MKNYTQLNNFFLNKYNRSITTRAKSISSKVSRTLKNAQLQQASMETKIKTNATAALKTKAEQASKVLKLPTDHLLWSVYLIQTSMKSIIKAYEIWYSNMNKYTLFRWIATIITYLVWPLQKAIQILAYLKFFRLIMLIIVFIVGLFTDSKEVKMYLTDTTSLVAINLDYFLNITLEKFQFWVNSFREYVYQNHYSFDPESMEKVFPKPIEVPAFEEKSNTALYVTIGITVFFITAALIWIYCNSGDTPPTTAILEPSSSKVPASILKGKAPEGASSAITDIAKSKTVRFQEYTVGIFTSAFDYCKLAKDNLADIIDRVRTGNIEGLVDPSTSTKLAELKKSAETSVQAGENMFPKPVYADNAVQAGTSFSDFTDKSTQSENFSFPNSPESLYSSTSPASNPDILGDTSTQSSPVTGSLMPTPENTPEKAKTFFFASDSSPSSTSSMLGSPSSNVNTLDIQRTSSSLDLTGPSSSTNLTQQSPLKDTYLPLSSSQESIASDSTVTPLNPKAPSFVPSNDNTRYPNIYSLLRGPRTVNKVSPISSLFGTIGFMQWEEIHDTVTREVADTEGNITTTTHKTIKKNFFKPQFCVKTVVI